MGTDKHNCHLEWHLLVPFSRKIDELFNGMFNVFIIANDILNARFDELGRVHNVTLNMMFKICTQSHLKLNRDKCLFRCTNIPFLVK